MTVPSAATVEESVRDFDSLFQTYYSRLARLLYRVTGDPSRAEDVAAEAFWRMYRRPPADQTNLEGWLYRTGLRLALDQVRKEKRRARYEALSSLFGMVAAPDRALEQNQDRARVRDALAALKAEQASLILLRAEGFSYSQIAATLHLNPASVGTLLARAEQALRKEYVHRYGER